MTEYVVDASVVAKWHFPEQSAERAATLLDQMTSGRARLSAPDLIICEFGNLVLRKVRIREVAGEDGEMIFADFLSAPLHFTPSPDLARAAFAVAQAVGCSFYDGLYVALAEISGAPLVTADLKLLNQLAGTGLSEVAVALDDVDS